ncbi:unnamed protein product [Ceutorhynchus assimilis]|uniref:Uncharacterized protein n=1 Tax=Ceutorhynchus assimilis TaxID=467358 RepID=A0A9N9QSA1_9CUCU|nr:unnamed protein product [Ceutorhynchus assimilis]
METEKTEESEGESSQNFENAKPEAVNLENMISQVFSSLDDIQPLVKADCDSLSTVEYYDPNTEKWMLAPAMSMMRSRLGVAVIKHNLYAFGGYNGKDRLSSVEVYDAIQKKWSVCIFSALGATALGDIIYVCGGYDGVTSLNSVERYHPNTNSWCSLAPMNKSRSAGAVIACQGNIYALGGHDGLSIFDSVERYNPTTNTWTEAPPMLTKRCRLGVAMLGGKLYACGGYDGSSFLQTVEMYCPRTNKKISLISQKSFKTPVQSMAFKYIKKLALYSTLRYNINIKYYLFHLVYQELINKWFVIDAETNLT